MSSAEWEKAFLEQRQNIKVFRSSSIFADLGSYHDFPSMHISSRSFHLAWTIRLCCCNRCSHGHRGSGSGKTVIICQNVWKDADRDFEFSGHRNTRLYSDKHYSSSSLVLEFSMLFYGPFFPQSLHTYVTSFASTFPSPLRSLAGRGLTL